MSRIPNLAQIFLRNCYSMLQNVRVTAFTVSELLRDNQQGGKVTSSPTTTTPPSTQIINLILNLLHHSKLKLLISCQ